jgi:aconitase A
MTITMHIHRPDRITTTVPLTCRVDTGVEATWLRHGGILPNALRTMTAEAVA